MVPDYEAMTLADLRELASERAISYRSLNKADLIDALQKHDREAVTQPEAGRVLTVDKPNVGPPLMEPKAIDTVPHVDPNDPHERAKAEARYEPPYEYYRITEDSRWIADGTIHTLSKGTVISSKTHPIELLKSQHVKMEPTDGPFELPRDAYGAPVYPRGQEPGRPDIERRPLVGHSDGATIVIGEDGKERLIMPESPSLKPPTGGRIV